MLNTAIKNPAPVALKTLEGEYIALSEITEQARSLGYMATQYEQYGRITAEEVIEAYIDEHITVAPSTLEAYNEYLRERNYFDDEIMNWDDLEAYLETLPALDAFKLAHNSDFSWNDDYFTFNGYGNLEGLQEYEVIRKMEGNRDFLKWYVDERHHVTIIDPAWEAEYIQGARYATRTA